MKRKASKADIEARQEKIAALRERLEEFQGGLEETDVAALTALWSGYSVRNALLIAMQCPTATEVAGFAAWKDRGRQVRKGEHGIQILAPAGKAADETNETGKVTRQGRQFFRLAYVFDIAQTDPLEAAVEEEPFDWEAAFEGNEQEL